MALSTRIVCVATLVGIFASLTAAIVPLPPLPIGGIGGLVPGVINKIPVFSAIQPLLPPILRDQTPEDDSVADGCKIICLAGAFNGTGTRELDGKIHLRGYIWGIVYVTILGQHIATPKLNGIYDWIMEEGSNDISFAGPAWGTLIGPDQPTNLVDLRSGEFACSGEPESQPDGSSITHFTGTLEKLQVSINILKIFQTVGIPVSVPYLATPGIPMEGRVDGTLIETDSGAITLTGEFQSMDYLVPISV